MRRALTVVAVAGMLVAGLGVHPATTEAAWSRDGFVTSTAVSGVLNAVPTVACGQASGLIAVSIPITWTAPPTTGNGVAPTAYRIDYAGTAGSGSTTSSTTSVGVPGSALTVAGTLVVSVYATRGAWVSPAPLQTRTITTTLGALGIIVGWTCA
ncbi:hypothetical protein ACFVWR_00770 [Leifsonia sp. NPDC058292]|uniref:hypothetical protein n=1 Tax=Leifsonia sp. NPDC058292 TaxID=3346428 RepID=UPI0036DE4CD5